MPYKNYKLKIELERASLSGNTRGPLSESDQVFVKDGEKCWFVKLEEIRLFESVWELRESLFLYQ